MATEYGVTIGFDYDLGGGNVSGAALIAELPYVEERIGGKIGEDGDVHASAETEGSWRLAVWLKCMMPLGARVEILGMASRFFVYGRLVVMQCPVRAVLANASYVKGLISLLLHVVAAVPLS